MLSYQHTFHAGNLADVHKHSILAWTLEYLTKKRKPITFIDTHSGRGLYNLKDKDALKTGEAASGIAKFKSVVPSETSFARVLKETETTFGPDHYAGSPMIALALLRSEDRLHFAERHPQEFRQLISVVPKKRGKCYATDGYELAVSLCPPTPRRGMLFVDPSYELSSDYTQMPTFVSKIVRRWNVGIIYVWYPLLATNRHSTMLDRLTNAFPDATRHEVRFKPAKTSHGMVGSGMFLINAPFGIEHETRRLSHLFKELPYR